MAQKQTRFYKRKSLKLALFGRPLLRGSQFMGTWIVRRRTKRKTNIFMIYFCEIALGRESGFQFPCKKYIFVSLFPWSKSQNTERFWNAARATTCSVTTRKKSLSVVTFLKKKHKQTNKQKQKGISQPGMIFLMVKNVLLLLQEKSNRSITNT